MLRLWYLPVMPQTIFAYALDGLDALPVAVQAEPGEPEAGPLADATREKKKGRERKRGHSRMALS